MHTNRIEPNFHSMSVINDFSLATPVAFFIFRRPDTTQRVFEVIARAKPPRLFVIADGPRNPEEAITCAKTRAIIDKVDWDCKVVTNYSDSNMGLKRRFASGLDWLFEQVDEAIILEDDCLPDDSFFRFCQELLQRYRDEHRVMHIGGNCFVNSQQTDASYHFSRFPRIWGWATWKRAWRFYEGDLQSWNTRSGKSAYLNKFSRQDERHFWKSTLNQVLKGDIDTWDYQWTYTCIKNGGLAINPSANLVSNIGFRPDATHTKDALNPMANVAAFPMHFPLNHPNNIQRDIVADDETAQMIFASSPELHPLLRKIIKPMRSIKALLKAAFKQN